MFSVYYLRDYKQREEGTALPRLHFTLMSLIYDGIKHDTQTVVNHQLHQGQGQLFMKRL